MKKYMAAAMCLLCLLLMAGCAKGSEPASLNSVPADATLLYTHQSNTENGSGMTLDAWENTDDTGFFVLEIICKSGSIKQLKLQKQGGAEIAAIGSVKEDAIYITDLATQASGSYALQIGRMKQFEGEINIYFVPGIGYSTAD